MVFKVQGQDGVCELRHILDDERISCGSPRNSCMNLLILDDGDIYCDDLEYFLYEIGDLR